MTTAIFTFTGLSVIDTGDTDLNMRFVNETGNQDVHRLNVSTRGFTHNAKPGSTIRISGDYTSMPKPSGLPFNDIELLDLGALHKGPLVHSRTPNAVDLKFPNARESHRYTVAQTSKPFRLARYLDGHKVDGSDVKATHYTETFGIRLKIANGGRIVLEGKWLEKNVPSLILPFNNNIPLYTINLDNICYQDFRKGEKCPRSYNDFPKVYTILPKPRVNDKDEDIRIEMGSRSSNFSEPVGREKDTIKKSKGIDILALEIGCLPVKGGGGS